MLYQVAYFILAPKPIPVEVSTIECSTFPHSYYFFCSTCGEVWARIATSSLEFPYKKPLWFPRHTPCEKHSTSAVWEEHFPGSLLQAYGRLTRSSLAEPDAPLAIESFPKKLLHRELELAILHFEQSQQTK